MRTARVLTRMVRGASRSESDSIVTFGSPLGGGRALAVLDAAQARCREAVPSGPVRRGLRAVHSASADRTAELPRRLAGRPAVGWAPCGLRSGRRRAADMDAMPLFGGWLQLSSRRRRLLGC